jgi:hypothetical protein
MAVALAVFLAVIVAPGSADQPTVITVNVAPFTDVNPCTGLLHTVNISLTIFLHDGHNNNVVQHVDRSGFTDSGYEMFSGQSQSVNNGHVITAHFRDLWRNDEGSIFEAAGRLKVNLNQGVVQINEAGLRCIQE